MSSSGSFLFASACSGEVIWGTKAIWPSGKKTACPSWVQGCHPCLSVAMAQPVLWRWDRQIFGSKSNPTPFRFSPGFQAFVIAWLWMWQRPYIILLGRASIGLRIVIVLRPIFAMLAGNRDDAVASFLSFFLFFFFFGGWRERGECPWEDASSLLSVILLLLKVRGGVFVPSISLQGKHY